MSSRSSCIRVAALGWLLAGALAPARAAAEPQKVILVEAVTGPSLSTTGKERLAKEIADVARRNGFVPTPATSLPEHLQHCELPACLPQIAAASGAMLVLAVDGQFAKESFKLALALWNADESTLVAKDTRDCPICDEQDLWGTAALVAQGLFERYARHEQPETSGKSAVGSSTLTSPPTDHAAPDAGGKVAFYSGLALAAAGLVTLAIGTYYIAEDGKASCAHCDRVRDTRKYGLPLAIVGGVAAVGGGALWTWSLFAGEAQVGVGLRGLQLARRF